MCGIDSYRCSGTSLHSNNTGGILLLHILRCLIVEDGRGLILEVLGLILIVFNFSDQGDRQMSEAIGWFIILMIFPFGILIAILALPFAGVSWAKEKIDENREMKHEHEEMRMEQLRMKREIEELRRDKSSS